MNLSQKFFAVQERLSSIGPHEKLTKFSLFLIILLDIFIFSMIGAGIAENTRIIASPEDYAGYQCRSLFDDLSAGNSDQKIQTIVRALENEFSQKNQGYSYYYSQGFGNTIACQKLSSLIKSSASLYTSHIIPLRAEEKKVTDLDQEMSNLSGSYNILLLEKIAGQTEEQSITIGDADTIASQLEEMGKKRTQENTAVRALYVAFAELPITKEILSLTEKDYPETKKHYESLVFWHPVKTFGMEIVFLIPLFIVGFFWSRRSIQKNAHVQSLISAHLLGILSVFVTLKAIQFILDILPHRLITRIIEWLTSWNIIAVWYYVLVFGAILVVMGLVYFIQKKIFSRKRLEAQRADKGCCIACSVRLQNDADFCHRCGASQKKTCICGASINATASFCPSCGKEQGNI